MTSSPEYRARMTELIRSGCYEAAGEMVEDAYNHSDEHIHLQELIGEALAIFRDLVDPKLVKCPECLRQVDPANLCCSVVAKPCPILAAKAKTPEAEKAPKTSRPFIAALEYKDYQLMTAIDRLGEASAGKIHAEVEGLMSKSTVYYKLKRLNAIRLVAFRETRVRFTVGAKGRRRVVWHVTGGYCRSVNGL